MKPRRLHIGPSKSKLLDIGSSLRGTLLKKERVCSPGKVQLVLSVGNISPFDRLGWTAMATSFCNVVLRSIRFHLWGLPLLFGPNPFVPSRIGVWSGLAILLGGTNTWYCFYSKA